MGSLNTDSLSPFGSLAVKLDCDFSELERLSGQIQRLDIDSENGLDRAVKLLGQFAQHGQSITEGIQDFSKSLQAARESSEKAAALVFERALLIQQRKQEQEQLQEKLGQLGLKVKQVSETLANQSPLPEQIESLDSYLAEFMTEVQAIKDEASRTKLKGIERNAESLFGTLQSARRKLNALTQTKH
jgi:chromosome segregation ATPase